MTWREFGNEAIRWLEHYTVARDYCAPGLVSLPSSILDYFPNCVRKPPLNILVPHYHRIDRRFPVVGFATWDEAAILYNYALRFRGLQFLEIGSWVGWTTLALALGGLRLTAVDPVFGGLPQGESCKGSLAKAGLLEHVEIVAGASPEVVNTLGSGGRKWSAFFIDGSHEGSAPLIDAQTCASVAEQDSIILFHDLALQNIGDALAWLQLQGWRCGVHYTTHFLGVAWRGRMEPLSHQPDPRVDWVWAIKRRWPQLLRFPSLNSVRSVATGG